MSGWLIGLIAVEYLAIGVWFVVEGKYGLALFAVGCTIANVGLILAARTT